MIKQSTPQQVILYARFSPRSRAADCQSCVVQLEDLRQYAAAHGYQVAGEFHDDALSGGDSWEDRPGMLAASVACKRGMIFMVRDFDRLFRDTQMGLAFCGLIEGKGASILSTTQEAASLNSPEARLMRSIFFSIAEYQRTIIKARTKVKMLAHQRAGRLMSHHAPYGMRVKRESVGRTARPGEPRFLEPDPHEQRVLLVIKSLADEGLAPFTIARRLGDQRLTARGGKAWHPNQIVRILRREGWLKQEIDS